MNVYKALSFDIAGMISVNMIRSVISKQRGVVAALIKQDLPEGFQTSEFLLDHGFLDFIVDRKDLKQKIGDLVCYF